MKLFEKMKMSITKKKRLDPARRTPFTREEPAVEVPCDEADVPDKKERRRGAFYTIIRIALIGVQIVCAISCALIFLDLHFDSLVMNELDRSILPYREEAALEGGFSSGLVDELRADIADRFGIAKSDIAFKADEWAAEPGGRINYELSFEKIGLETIKKFFGLGGGEGSRYRIKGFVHDRSDSLV
jgi:hypothetical protein